MDDRTYVPGMSDNSFSESGNDTFSPNVKNGNSVGGNAKRNSYKQPTLESPVVGFLYSISRKGIGEYWPVFLGPNTIGRSAENDIQLLEGTISDKHACLSVKRMHSNGRLIASIRDVGSKTGMYLNKEELDYDNHSCKNGDIITIGSNYQLLLMLVETDEHGLKVAENFIPVADEGTAPNSMKDNIYARGNAAKAQGPAEQGFNPYSPRNRKYVENATIDLNGDSNNDFGNETNFMP